MLNSTNFSTNSSIIDCKGRLRAEHEDTLGPVLLMSAGFSFSTLTQINTICCFAGLISSVMLVYVSIKGA